MRTRALRLRPRIKNGRQGDRAGNRGLCGARPRNQQLPAADRLSVGDSFRVVDSFSRIIRLGEGVSATGCISEAAIERAIAALSICRDKIQRQEGEAPAADRHRSLPRGVQCRLFPRPRRGRDRHPAGGDRSRDRGCACGDRLLAAARPQGPRRDPVRYRRRVDRAGSDRARPCRDKRGAAHQGLDVDSARRRHAGRAFRRP